jgi:glyoxylase-like metal-dependent hydrolase (beta-lactamase superfamily II)
MKSARASVLALLASASLLACTGDAGPPGPAGGEGPEGPAGEPGNLDPSLSTYQKLLAGMGGESALQALQSLRVTAQGRRYQPGESYDPHGAAPLTGHFDVTVSHEVASGSWRLDYQRTIDFAGGAPLDYAEIIQGDVGSVDGNDSIIGFPTGDMLSSRWAATVKQQELLHPQLLILQLLADPQSATEAGVGLHDGVVHEILAIDHPVAPVELWVRPSTGHVSKLVTLENDHLHRDSQLEVHYGGWQLAGEGPSFAREVFLLLGGQILHEEQRSDIEVNPSLGDDSFALPDGAMPAHDAELASWGETSAQFHNQFSALGIPIDFVQSYVEPVELQAGVHHLIGGTHHSLAVEQDGGVVIVEPPLYPERSEAVLAWVQSAIGKPVTHVVVTHHHEDHAGGLRDYVAAGATVVVAENARAFIAEVAAAPSTLAPDALSQGPVAPVFHSVPLLGSVVIADATNPVEIHHLPNGHASDMVVAYLPNGGYLFESDLYNPGNGGSSFAKIFVQQLHDGIAPLGVATLVGGHGGVAPLSELQAWLMNN